MSPREREVRQRATELLARLRVTCPPIDPYWIARQQDLEIWEGALPNGYFAALVKEGDRFGIVVSESCPTRGHRRFSVAHELGHYNVDGHVEEMVLSSVGSTLTTERLSPDRKDQVEDEADWFASELLVPTEQGAPRVLEMPPCFGSIEFLSDEFDTSRTMMAIRYAELTDRCVASVRSFEGRVERVALSRRFREFAWSDRLGPSDPVPDGTVSFGLTRDSATLPIGKIRAGRVLAANWFAGAPPTLELKEESLWLGSRYGRVLTLLFAD